MPRDGMLVYKNSSTSNRRTPNQSYPTNPSRAGNELYTWVCNQRQLYRRLTDERAQQLRAVAGDDFFDAYWTRQQRQWDQMWRERYEAYRLSEESRNSTDVQKWMRSQIQSYRSGLLLPHREALLTEAGFDFPSKHSQSAHWNRRFQQLVTYHSNINSNNTDLWSAFNGTVHKSLYRWATHQRKLYHIGSLAKEREKHLRSIGFPLDDACFRSIGGCYPNDQKWAQQFDAYVGLLRTDPDGRVVHPRSKDIFIYSSNLGSWVILQRKSFRTGTMPKGRQSKLASIGFELDGIGRDAMWWRHLENLKQFKVHFGDIPPLVAHSRSSMLASWAHRQRRRYHQGLLQADKKRALMDIDSWFGIRPGTSARLPRPKDDQLWSKRFACIQRRERAH